VPPNTNTSLMSRVILNIPKSIGNQFEIVREQTSCFQQNARFTTGEDCPAYEHVEFRVLYNKIKLQRKIPAVTLLENC